MRVVSLIPSWTETLVESGVEVVGRTRFCVRPENAIGSIPIVGGTKNADWTLIQNLNPDFVLMEKEENTKEMSLACPCPLLVTHVTSLPSLSQELLNLSQKLQCTGLLQLKARLDTVLTKSVPKWNWAKMPGVIQHWPKTHPTNKIFYVIWKKPWMCVGPDTFVYSMLSFLNAPVASWDQKKYSKMDILPTDPENYYLFSTEPYPFADKINEITRYNGAIVDGENYSWFGYRAIQFLEKTLGLTT